MRHGAATTSHSYVLFKSWVYYHSFSFERDLVTTPLLIAMALSSVAVPLPMIRTSTFETQRSLEEEGGDDQYELPAEDSLQDDGGSAVVFVGQANSTAGEDNSSVFGTYERGCQLSNDPGYADEANQVPYLPVCNLTSYLCLPKPSEEQEQTTALEISFDYELHYNPNSDLVSILRYYEELSLDHLATEMGLRNCTTSNATETSSPPVADGKARWLEAFPADTRAMFGGIDLFPRDWPDARHPNCLVLVDESLRSTSACVPTRGAMTVYMNPNRNGSSLSGLQTDHIRSLLLREIKRGMDEDLYLTKMNILKMVYVGDRQQLEASIAASTQSSQGANGARDLSSGTIALIAALAALAVIGLVFALLTVRRRKEQHRRSERRREIEDEDSTIPPDWHIPEDRGLGRPVQRSLAVRDSLALKPQKYWPSGWWPSGEDCAATDATTNSSGSPNPSGPPSSTGSPNRLLMSPSGGECPLQPPSSFYSRRSMTSFDSSMLGVYTMGSDLTNPEEPVPDGRSRSPPQLQTLQLHQNAVRLSGSAGPEDTVAARQQQQVGRGGPPRYIEPYLGSAGGSSSYNDGDDDSEIPDSGSERSARRTLQMT
jgi:hypothetical protein